MKSSENKQQLIPNEFKKDEWLTSSEACKLARLNKYSFFKWCAKNGVKYYIPLTKKRLFRRSDVLAALENMPAHEIGKGIE